MKIRIVKPEVNAIQNDWGYEYDYSDTVEIELDDFPQWFVDSITFSETDSMNVESMILLKDITSIIGHFIEVKAKELSIDED
jgi:hypothetical protein